MSASTTKGDNGSNFIPFASFRSSATPFRPPSLRGTSLGHQGCSIVSHHAPRRTRPGNQRHSLHCHTNSERTHHTSHHTIRQPPQQQTQPQTKLHQHNNHTNTTRQHRSHDTRHRENEHETTCVDLESVVGLTFALLRLNDGLKWLAVWMRGDELGRGIDRSSSSTLTILAPVILTNIASDKHCKKGA